MRGLPAYRTVALLLLAIGSRFVAAQEPAADRAAELAALVARYQSRHQQHLEAVRNLREGEPSPSTEYWVTEYPEHFLTFARAANDEASLAACKFLIETFYISPRVPDAIALVERQHFDKPLIGQFLAVLVHSYAYDLFVNDCLEAAMQSPHASARLHGHYQAARLIIDRRDWCLEGDEQRADFIETLGEERVVALLSDDGRRQAVGYLQTVITQAGDERYFNYSLAERARLDLYELEHLEVGQPAPETEGPDARGETFRLSDYRGKVVVVVWWAHWCGACMDALPREMQFVEQMKGRPLVWLGVNGDDERALLRTAEENGTAGFRSWHDGSEGPIARQWNVWGWPAMYVVDAQGVIRYKSRVTVELDQALPEIEKLVAEIEARR